MTAGTRCRARNSNAETGWQPQMPFEEGLQSTVDWYRENRDWVNRVKSGEYQDFYTANYTR